MLNSAVLLIIQGEFISHEREERSCCCRYRYHVTLGCTSHGEGVEPGGDARGFSGLLISNELSFFVLPLMWDQSIPAAQKTTSEKGFKRFGFK